MSLCKYPSKAYSRGKSTTKKINDRIDLLNLKDVVLVSQSTPQLEKTPFLTR